MVIRDASNAGWVRLDPHSDESYFGGMFLKPHPRKKDGGLVFSIPANMKPPVFGLVFNTSLWKKVEEFREAEVCSDLTHATLMFRLLLFWQIYNGRSLSAPDTGELPPMAELQAGYSAHTKRKAGAPKGPRKVPRRDPQSPKTQKVYVDSSSDDEAMVPLRLPVDGGANSASASGFDEDEDFVRVGQKEELKIADNNDQEERGHTGDEESGSEDFFNKVDKLRSTTTVATRGRVADSNLKLPLARHVQVASTSTVSTMSKPFTLPIDFESIRKGFLEGGVKSTDGKSTSSTSHKLQHLKDSSHLGTFRSIHLRAHHLPQPTTAHFCGANRQTQQAEARYAGPRCRNI